MSSLPKSEGNFELDFARACGKPSCTALIREAPEYFYVEELLGFSPSGEGEHLYLLLEKKGVNTDYLAKQLSRLANIRSMDVGYAGLKDRHAVARQWFSLYLPGDVSIDRQQIERIDGIKVLAMERHSRKLRRGQHQGNRFRLRLSRLAGDLNDLAARLERIGDGVPNYFGLQRFGIAGNNLVAADRMFAKAIKPPGKHLRGIYLSAARSYLFNRVLSQRVEEGSWQRPEEGDRLMEAGLNHSQLVVTGPLWGRGKLETESRIAALENDLAQTHAKWLDGLEHCGLQQQRRPLCLWPEALTWRIEEDALDIEFMLPAGSYATSVIREICIVDDVGRQQTEAGWDLEGR